MKPLFQLNSSALALAMGVASMALAGPADVPTAPHPSSLSYEPLGELRPHHALKVPQAPQQTQALPQPAVPDAAVDSGEIRVSESGSLLAYQGLLPPEGTGFQPNAWRYMQQEQAASLIAKLPGEVSLSRLKNSLIDLMQLRADPPQGATDEWFSIRLAALEKLGASAQAEAMLLQVPASLRSQMNPAALFTFFLRQHKTKLACSMIADMRKPESQDEQSWRMMQLYCHGALGRFAKLELELALAEENNTPYPNWFVSVLEKFQYHDVPLPDTSGVANPLFQAMIMAAADKPLPTKPAEADFPRQPAYAMKAVAKLIRKGELSQTQSWLAMLDSGDNESASSYVAHELVRFVGDDEPESHSVAAMTLPPYSDLPQVSGADRDLLLRYYQLMPAFGYFLPAPVDEWVQQQEQAAPAALIADAHSPLAAYIQKGNKAGYLMTLAKQLQQAPLQHISSQQISNIVFDLKRLGEEAIAKQLVVEAILQSLE